MLDIARRHTPPTATSFRWIQADAVSLPFPDGTFDVVFESTLLCFQSDPARVIREMVRVCLSGGTIVLGELNPFSPWQLWRRKGLARRFHLARGTLEFISRTDEDLVRKQL
jgi:ubiquinone/menaquinone biosynthesis C-methylase UbiE